MIDALLRPTPSHRRRPWATRLNYMDWWIERPSHPILAEGDFDEICVSIAFTFTPGGAATRDDPGYGPEFEIYDIRDTNGLIDFSDEEERGARNFVSENFEPDDGPDPDDARDARIDDEMTGHFA